ncbi:large conductance mechanosensitive channel protein MscL, partial [Lysobacter sp. 2RAB21]
GMISEFKEFIARGNVVDLAVGVVIGAAFGKIVTALVDGIVMPVIGYLSGGISVTDWKYVLKPSQLDAAGKEVAAEVAVKY